jgi:hypothetical protein
MLLRELVQDRFGLKYMSDELAALDGLTGKELAMNAFDNHVDRWLEAYVHRELTIFATIRALIYTRFCWGFSGCTMRSWGGNGPWLGERCVGWMKILADIGIGANLSSRIGISPFGCSLVLAERHLEVRIAHRSGKQRHEPGVFGAPDRCGPTGKKSYRILERNETQE